MKSINVSFPNVDIFEQKAESSSKQLEVICLISVIRHFLITNFDLRILFNFTLFNWHRVFKSAQGVPWDNTTGEKSLLSLLENLLLLPKNYVHVSMITLENEKDVMKQRRGK